MVGLWPLAFGRSQGVTWPMVKSNSGISLVERGGQNGTGLTRDYLRFGLCPTAAACWSAAVAAFSQWMSELGGPSVAGAGRFPRATPGRSPGHRTVAPWRLRVEMEPFGFGTFARTRRDSTRLTRLGRSAPWRFRRTAAHWRSPATRVIV